MDESRPSTPIGPSMRKVLNEITASKSERDVAAARLRAAQAASSAVDRSDGAAHDNELLACLQQQNAQLQALLQETASQTRLLAEILARLPVNPSSTLASEGRHERS